MKKLSEYSKDELKEMTHVDMGKITKKYYDSNKRILMTKLIEDWKIEEKVAKNVVGL
jgi:hypothetical protein